MEIRAAWKEDLKATFAEIVFNETIKLLEQFLEERPISTLESVVGRLRKTMQKFRSILRRHGTKTIFVFKKMYKEQKIFVKQDMPTKTLQPSYKGPSTK